MNHLIIGVDPGQTGGIALLDADTGRPVAIFPMPCVDGQVDGDVLASLLQAHGAEVRPCRAYVEQVHSRPRQQGQFTFGVNTGIVLGVLMSFGVPIVRVAPASWKAAFKLKREHDEDKSVVKTAARQLAATLFPSHAKSFARVKDDGVAEATLIALYGVGHFSKGQK